MVNSPLPDTVNFREQFRKTWTNPAHSDQMNGAMNSTENTPLLGHPFASEDRRGFWRKLLLDRRHTPGTDDPNPLVKWPARVFNVAKAALLSSRLPPYPLLLAPQGPLHWVN